MSAAWRHRQYVISESIETHRFPLGAEIIGARMANDRPCVLFKAKIKAIQDLRDDQAMGFDVTIRWVDEDHNIGVADMKRLELIDIMEYATSMKYVYREVPDVTASR